MLLQVHAWSLLPLHYIVKIHGCIFLLYNLSSLHSIDIFVVIMIAEAVLENFLLPTLNEIKCDLNSIRDNVGRLNETVKTLAEEHREDTQYRFAEIETELAATKASIQSVIDNPPTEEISQSVLQLLLPYLSNIEEEIETDIEDTVTFTKIILRDELMDYKKKTILQQANDVQSLVDTDDLICLKTDLVDVQSSIENVNDTLKDINDTNTDQLMQLLAKMDTVHDEIDSIDEGISTNFNKLHATLTSQFNVSNTKLDSMNNLISNDFNDIKTELSGINVITNEIVDEIEDHEQQTKLTDIGSLICDTHDFNCRCGDTSVWRRVVSLDMTDPNTECPSGWDLTNYNIRTCGRANNAYYTCDSLYFSVNGGEYSHVCGKIKAYQWGFTSGFAAYNNRGQTTINQAYFGGVAVMHGSPRQHIWSFVAGGAENDPRNNFAQCPCDTQGSNIVVPSFVGDDYFCEAGFIYPWPNGLYVFHSDDPLWDGDGCDSSSTCCTFHNPPSFTKSLDNPTTDDIELRLCSTTPALYENVAVELIEIYVRN